MRMISHYRLEEELGHGGMGEVYKASDRTLNRTVVIKLLSSDLIADPSSRGRFLREARLSSSLNHPNICTVYEAAEADGRFFMVMQFVEGKTLKKLIGGRPIPLDALFSIGMQVADALAFAHSKGIIHRDIKSSNIIVTPRGQAIVLDFGLAKLLIVHDRPSAASGMEVDETRVGMPLGTPSYMSPEQAKGERADHRSDIFSFGVILYEMATGELPFKGTSQVEIMNGVIHNSYPPVTELNKKVPAQLANIIDRAMAKRPSDRYQSINLLVEDLRVLALGLKFSGGEIPDGVFVPFVKPRRRTPLRKITHWFKNLFGVEESADVHSGPSHLPGGREFRDGTDFTLTGGARKTLAVLPFRNLSGDPEIDFYGLSLADSLTTELAKLRTMEVRASTITAKYQNRAVDIAKVGKEVDAGAILTGNFVKAGDKLRVTAQLLDSSGGKILWSDKIDIPSHDVLAVQDHISQRIVTGLSSGHVNVDPIDLLRDENEEIRLDAVRVLKFSHDPRALSALLEALRDPSLRVKAEAVQALVIFRQGATGPVIQLLNDALDEGDRMTARFAAKTLGLIGDSGISPVLVHLLTIEDPFVVCEAALALGRIKESRVVPELIKLLDDSNANLRFAAVEALGQISDPSAIEALQKTLKDGDEGVRAKARWALSRLKQMSGAVAHI